MLMAAVRAGVGRETAHELIKEHAVGSALAMRQEGTGNRLLERLADDERFPLDRAALDALLADRITFTGAAADQVATVVSRIEAITAVRPRAAAYSPGSIL
jgi:adenylosuccinate lyase